MANNVKFGVEEKASAMQLGGKSSITVMLPHSFASDIPSLREATVRIGFVGRVLATFRVEELLLYPDKPGSPDIRNARLVKEILDYLTTAPYLRKKLYPLKQSLRYAGLLPPLNIHTHPDADAVKEEGVHYRQALVTASGETSTVEAGLGRPLKIHKKLPKNSIVNLKISIKAGRIKYKLFPKKSSEVYTGFRTRIANSLAEELKRYGARIATSRLGMPVTEALQRLAELMKSSDKVCVVFGASDRGLREIAEDLGLEYDQLFSITVNFAPNQAVKTIRTEEALAYTLAILNTI
ncbi:MAG: putative RNA uridine N3 methyltransferase [Candidatus Caldarchaeum sp.]